MRSRIPSRNYWKLSSMYVASLWKGNRHWVWQAILLPYIVTRLMLLSIGLLSPAVLPQDPHFLSYGEVARRGWVFTPHRVLDIWGRWDSTWYYDVVQKGYQFQGDIQQVQSNIAFFPLYPYLVKFIGSLFLAHSPGRILLVGIVVSNLFFLGALVLFYQLALSLFHDERLARRGVLYVLLFPLSFIFSSFYAESTFLFFSLAAFYAASKHNWAIACICGACLALTRPPGILILVPLGLIYLQSLNWNLRKIRWNIAWFGLIPAALFGFLLSIYHLDGDLLAPLKIQLAWGRSFAMPWQTLIQPEWYNSYAAMFDRLMAIGIIILAIIALAKLPMAYGIYTLLLALFSLMSGSLMGFGRHCAILFPAFIILAWFGKQPAINRLITLLSLTILALFMAGWSQFYAII